MKYLLFALMIVLVGCSSTTNGIEKDMYEDGIDYYETVETAVNESRELTEAELRKLDVFEETYDWLGDEEMDHNKVALHQALTSMRDYVEFDYDDAEFYVNARKDAAEILDVK
ncbi:hypothetical protein ACTWQL_13720 [Pseudalkalibacillus sp. R45]|uniref:hypothetical protein n=1 Tax=Pseudalkalibacillus sp. R45 TaxID=3457433 RepID=UPI003FCC3471